MVTNNEPLAADVLRRYKSKGSEPVLADPAELRRAGLQCVFDNLLEVHGVVRHDSRRLASFLLKRFIQ